jgi:Barrel-sandwich domain of CusB or HlyD membrane-fusion
MQTLMVAAMLLLGCRASKSDPEAEAPPPAQVNLEGFKLIQVEHPENFPVVRATEYVAKLQTTAIGTVVSNRSLSVATVPSGLDRKKPTDSRFAWIECAVYRSDIAGLKVGAAVEVQAQHQAAKTFAGRVAAISPASGTPLTTAKVRITTRAPELLPGAFVIAAFPAYRKQAHAAVPESALLNFRDRHCVYVPSGEKAFRRVDVVTGSVLPRNMREIVDGIQPAESVVQNLRDLLRSLEP